MKILFLGNNYNPISVACLENILADCEHSVTAGIYAPEDSSIINAAKEIFRAHGSLFLIRKGIRFLLSFLRLRLRKTGASWDSNASLRELAIAHNLPSFRYDSEAVSRMKELAPDLIVVAAFNRILKADVIDIPGKGCINVHPSLLPAYRGPNPFYWVLKNKEEKTGVTIHYIDIGVDSGDIIKQAEIPVSPNDTQVTLRDKSLVVSGKLLSEVIQLIEKGEVERSPQNEAEASYYSFPPKGTAIL
jgi:folate-dependent phosphoribosylglycinamide formyltransferase PurN